MFQDHNIVPDGINSLHTVHTFGYPFDPMTIKMIWKDTAVKGGHYYSHLLAENADQQVSLKS